MQDLLNVMIPDAIFVLTLLFFTLKLTKAGMTLFHYIIIIALSCTVFINKNDLFNPLFIALIITLYLIYVIKVGHFKAISSMYISFIALLLYTSCIKLISENLNLSGIAGVSLYSTLIAIPLLWPKHTIEPSEDKKINNLVLLSIIASGIIIYTFVFTTNIGLLIFAFAIYLLTLVLMYLTHYLHVANFKYDCMEKELENTKNINLRMHSQKHDFNNHIQVISSLIQAKKFDACFDYIINVNRHGFSKDNINTGLQAINALLSAKQETAQNELISFDFDILENIPQNFNMQAWEIVSILGNLIDNAIYAEKNSTKDKKQITFSLKKQGAYLEFSLNNLGSYIDPVTLSKIFAPGFSLKGAKNQGMGLHIIKDSVERHNGFLNVESTIENGTTFTLLFPEDIPNAIIEDLM